MARDKTMARRERKEREEKEINKIINEVTVIAYIYTVTVTPLYICTIIDKLMWEFFTSYCVNFITFCILEA